MKHEPTKEAYNAYVEDITPTHSCMKNCLNAFICGGLICTLGQLLANWISGPGNMNEADTASYVSLILVALSVTLTGFNLYRPLAKWGGAGALVPITGFANGVAAPCIEFQKEGQVFGIGVKCFTIAGPVILYGIFTSWVLGLIYWILQAMHIV